MIFYINDDRGVAYIMGRPIPRPGIIGGASPPAFGLLIVSSTDRIRHVASPAACNAFILITDGSQTHASKLSAICSFVISTPNHVLPENDQNEKAIHKLPCLIKCSFNKTHLVRAFDEAYSKCSLHRSRHCRTIDVG